MTLVLLPGMDGTGELFSPFLLALTPDIKSTVVTYPTSEPFDYAQLESIVRAALPSHGSYILLAESFSGPIAVSIAASAPSRLKGLVLCASFVRTPRPAFSGLRFVLPALPVAMVPLTILDYLLLGRFSTPALRATLAGSLRKVSSATIRARVRAVMSIDMSAELSKIKVPVLYLRALRDRIVPSSASALISTISPGARIVDVEAPHFLLQSSPVEAARLVRAFMDEVETYRTEDCIGKQKGPAPL